MDRDNKYQVTGSAYVFWDPRLVAWGTGLKTRLDDIVVPSKTMFSNCVHQGRGGDWQSGMFGREDLTDPVGGGVHNDTETFMFVDGHGDFYSTDPIRQWYLSTSAYLLIGSSAESVGQMIFKWRSIRTAASGSGAARGRPLRSVASVVGPFGRGPTPKATELQGLEADV